MRLINKMNIILISLCFFYITGNCQQQQPSPTILFEQFVTYVAKDYPKFTKKDWVKADTTYNRFCRKLEAKKGKLTEEDKDKISKLRGKYKGYKFKFEAQKTYDDVKEVVKDVGYQLDGFIDALKKD